MNTYKYNGLCAWHNSNNNAGNNTFATIISRIMYVQRSENNHNTTFEINNNKYQ